MTKLLWGEAGQRFFETGVDRGVLYLDDAVVPWTGLTSVDEDFGTDSTAPYFLDGVKYLDVPITGDFVATINAFTYPDEFLDYEGIGEIGNGLYVDDQSAKPFGFSYRTRIGNDVDSDKDYKLHICYNLSAVQSDVVHGTQADTIDPVVFSWSIAGVPEDAPGFAPTAHVIIDSRYVYSHLLSDLEDILYGTDTQDPRLPALTELIPLVTGWKLFYVYDNGDGTWTADVPDEYLTWDVTGTQWTVTNADVVFIDSNTYELTDSYEPKGG